MFVNVVDKKKLFLVRRTFGFCVGQTDSKYAQNSDSRALATAKGCIGTSGRDGGITEWVCSSFSGSRKGKNR